MGGDGWEEKPVIVSLRKVFLTFNVQVMKIINLLNKFMKEQIPGLDFLKLKSWADSFWALPLALTHPF